MSISSFIICITFPHRISPMDGGYYNSILPPPPSPPSPSSLLLLTRSGPSGYIPNSRLLCSHNGQPHLVSTSISPASVPGGHHTPLPRLDHYVAELPFTPRQPASGPIASFRCPPLARARVEQIPIESKPHNNSCAAVPAPTVSYDTIQGEGLYNNAIAVKQILRKFLMRIIHEFFMLLLSQ